MIKQCYKLYNVFREGSNDYNKVPRAEMLNLLFDGGGDDRRYVLMDPSVQALVLKDVGWFPGVAGSSVNSLNMFVNMAMTCRIEIIGNNQYVCYVRITDYLPRAVYQKKRKIIFFSGDRRHHDYYRSRHCIFSSPISCVCARATYVEERLIY